VNLISGLVLRYGPGGGVSGKMSEGSDMGGLGSGNKGKEDRFVRTNWSKAALSTFLGGWGGAVVKNRGSGCTCLEGKQDKLAEHPPRGHQSTYSRQVR